MIKLQPFLLFERKMLRADNFIECKSKATRGNVKEMFKHSNIPDYPDPRYWASSHPWRKLHKAKSTINIVPNNQQPRHPNSHPTLEMLYPICCVCP